MSKSKENANSKVLKFTRQQFYDAYQQWAVSLGNVLHRLGPANEIERVARQFQRVLVMEYPGKNYLYFEIDKDSWEIAYSTQVDSLVAVHYSPNGKSDKFVKLADFLYEHYNPEGLHMLEKSTFNNLT